MINNILIVDDQVSFLEGLSKALARYCGYSGEITTVCNGEKALAEIGSRFYDICFLDLNMPGIGGMEVMERISSISPETKVVIVTAEYIDNLMKEKIDENASLLISKPVELDKVKFFINEESKLSDDSCDKEQKGNHNMHDKRQSVREPYNIKAYYSVCVFYNWELKSNMQADIIDLSREGVGVRVDYPVYPGNILRFDSTMENKSGLVKWSSKEINSFRAGIKFM